MINTKHNGKYLLSYSFWIYLFRSQIRLLRKRLFLIKQILYHLHTVEQRMYEPIPQQFCLKKSCSPQLQECQIFNSNSKTVKNGFVQHRSSPLLIKNEIDESKIDVISEKCVRIMNLLGVQKRNKTSISSIFRISDMLDQIEKNVMNSQQVYKEIEQYLQKQQQINRSLIKKQLQIREEQKSMYEELNQLKTSNHKLNKYIQSLTQQLHEKQLELSSFKNQLKANHRQKFNNSQNNHYLLYQKDQYPDNTEELIKRLNGNIYYVRSNRQCDSKNECPKNQKINENKNGRYVKVEDYLNGHIKEQMKIKEKQDHGKGKEKKEKSKSVHLGHHKRRKSEDNPSNSKKEQTRRKSSLIRK